METEEKVSEDQKVNLIFVFICREIYIVLFQLLNYF